MGLGYLARTARTVVGGDIDDIVLAIARNHYQGRPNIIVKKFDAQELPFPNQSFDVVLLYETIYYLASPEKFVQEAKRVLRPEGRLIIGSVNKEWPDFNPSPFSRKYFTAAEVAEQLRPHFREIQAFGAFPVRAATPRDRIVSLFKRTAIKLRLMPKTMKGKELFKRIFFGRRLRSRRSSRTTASQTPRCCLLRSTLRILRSRSSMLLRTADIMW